MAGDPNGTSKTTFQCHSERSVKLQSKKLSLGNPRPPCTHKMLFSASIANQLNEANKSGSIGELVGPIGGFECGSAKRDVH